MVKKVLAVSGGMDSMVMLDRMLGEVLAGKIKRDELVVATFNHGTRESAKTDAEFVLKKAKENGIKSYYGEAKLGAGVSEEKAREERYKFLREVAFKERGEIFTAHHLDDLIETIAINFLRGTGWRGLASFSSFGIRRPLIDGFFSPEEFGFKLFDKKAILKYAAEKKIVFREDPTNSSDDYLRNRLREKTRSLDFKTKGQVFQLWVQEKEIKREVEKILESILPENRVYERNWFHSLDEKSSLEFLRYITIRANISATRPQLMDFLNAIKTYRSGKKFNLPEDKLVKLNKNEFRL